MKAMASKIDLKTREIKTSCVAADLALLFKNGNIGLTRLCELPSCA
jgi:hypothetical protein